MIRYTTKDGASSNPEQVENDLERELKALKRQKRRIDVVYRHDGKGKRIVRETQAATRIPGRRHSNVQVALPGWKVVNSDKQLHA